MSLADLASIGSFISGIAVLISFVFLAFQLRQNAHNQRATDHNERTALTQDIALGIASSRESSEVYRRGAEADATLDMADCNWYLGYALSAFWAYEEFFYQHRDGMIDEARWATNVRRLRSMVTQPGFRAAWRVFSSRWFESDFVDWFNKIMSETPIVVGWAVLASAWRGAANRELAEAAGSSS